MGSDHPNVDVVNRMTKAIFDQDHDALATVFTDDLAFHLRGGHPMAGDHDGLGGFLGGLVGWKADAAITAAAGRARNATGAKRIAAWQEIARRLAHEIKNPLTPIRLNIEHLQQVWSDQRGQGALDERFLAIHAMLTTDREISLLAEAGAAVAHAPIVCTDIVSAVTKVVAMRNAGITVGPFADATFGVKYSYAVTDLFGYTDSDGSGYLDLNATWVVAGAAVVGISRALLA